MGFKTTLDEMNRVVEFKVVYVSLEIDGYHSAVSYFSNMMN